MIRRSEAEIQLSDRGVRYRRAWTPAEPRRVLVLVHGYAEHCGRYDEMAMHFAERGFAVHAYDQAGHGRTPGPRGDVDHFERLLDEAVAFVGHVRAHHPGLPVTLAGHSMGGLVVTGAATLREPDVDRVVLSGPLLDMGETGRGWRRTMMRLLAPLGARAGFAAGLDPDALSRDPEVGRCYLADPLVKDRMTARFGASMMKVVDAIHDAGPRFRHPVMIQHGEADPLCPVAASRRLFSELRPEIATLSRLEIYPELRHEIWNEPERVRIWQDLLDWLDV